MENKILGHAKSFFILVLFYYSIYTYEIRFGGLLKILYHLLSGAISFIYWHVLFLSRQEISMLSVKIFEKNATLFCLFC